MQALISLVKLDNEKTLLISRRLLRITTLNPSDPATHSPGICSLTCSTHIMHILTWMAKKNQAFVCSSVLKMMKAHF